MQDKGRITTGKKGDMMIKRILPYRLWEVLESVLSPPLAIKALCICISRCLISVILFHSIRHAITLMEELVSLIPLLALLDQVCFSQ